MRWPLNYSTRTYRIAAVVIALAGIPTVITMWLDVGAIWGIVILLLHVYLALWVAFMLPWLQCRVRAGD